MEVEVYRKMLFEASTNKKIESDLETRHDTVTRNILDYTANKTWLAQGGGRCSMLAEKLWVDAQHMTAENAAVRIPRLAELDWMPRLTGLCVVVVNLQS